MKFTDIKEASLQNYAKARQHIEANSRYQRIKEFTLAHFLKRYVIVGIFLGIVTGYFFNIGWKSTSTSSITEYTVSTWTITNSIKAYGSAELIDEQQLRFNQQGEVTAVYFKKGDEVKKWDIIAKLDQSSVESNILQAEINLQNAKLQLDETLNGDRSAQILQAENNLEQSKLKLDVAQQEYDNLVEDQSNSWTIDDTETTMANARLDIQNYLLEWERTLDAVNKIFTDYPNNIWMENLSMTRIDARDALPTAYSKLSELKKYFSTELTSTDDKDNMLKCLSLTRETYQSIYLAATNVYLALQNSSYSQDFTQTTEDTLKEQVYSYSTKTKSSLSSILSTENKITNLWTSENDEIILQNKANEITNLKNTIAIQEKTLETTKNWTTEQQRQIAENNIKQKELALEQTQKDLDNLQIEAPFDGTIRKIDFKIWDKLTSSEEKYVYLENPNLVEISITLDQVDVVNVKAGMDVEVTMDAYPWITFEWVLGDIDSTPVVSNWVTSYTVKVSIDKWEKIIYSGMTATVKIIIENREGVITIPTTFIQSRWDKKYVLDNNDNQIDITVWSTDGTMTEIVSWLTVGDTIKKITTTNASTTSSSSSLMWGGMWGGMWWGGWMPPG